LESQAGSPRPIGTIELAETEIGRKAPEDYEQEQNRDVGAASAAPVLRPARGTLGVPPFG
jgi:hypothetical protein